jgi:hypothetical protein
MFSSANSLSGVPRTARTPPATVCSWAPYTPSPAANPGVLRPSRARPRRRASPRRSRLARWRKRRRSSSRASQDRLTGARPPRRTHRRRDRLSGQLPVGRAAAFISAPHVPSLLHCRCESSCLTLVWAVLELLITHQTNGTNFNALDRQRLKRARYHGNEQIIPKEATAGVRCPSGSPFSASRGRVHAAARASPMTSTRSSCTSDTRATPRERWLCAQWLPKTLPSQPCTPTRNRRGSAQRRDHS